MINPAVVAPAEAAVALIEDEPKMMDRLAREIQTLPNTSSVGTDQIGRFQQLLLAQQYDAVSVDWEIHNADRGPDILEMTRKAQPEVGKVVFSKHEDVENEAMYYGADVYLFKGRTAMSQFRAAIAGAVRLGFARRIAKLLRTAGIEVQCDFSPGKVIDPNCECDLYERALSYAREQAFDRSDGAELIKMLARRNWWRAFNDIEYLRLGWPNKLATLFSFVDEDHVALAHYLRLPQETAQRVLAGDDSPLDEKTLLHARELLAVLGFILRASDYRPEVMHYMWRRTVTSGANDPPPWNGHSPMEYLSECGPLGVNQAMIWIRSR